MINFIVLMIIIALVGGAVTYIIKEKKKGTKCIGCPMAGCCSSASCGGGDCSQECSCVDEEDNK